MAEQDPPAPGGATPEEQAEARRAANEAQIERLRRDYRHELNVTFGPHPAQRFDLYLPTATPAGPVMVFLHGGGFRIGAPGPVAHCGRPILEAGGVFVSLGYRLAPEVRFPDTVEDVELGLVRIAEVVRDAGADPARTFLSGHSAGAALGAFAALRPATPATAGIAGLVLISGMYALNRDESIDNHQSARYVPVLTDAIERVPPHTIVVAGDRDLPQVMPQAEALVAALDAARGSYEFFVEDDADHFQAIRGFATAGSPVAKSVLAMMGLSR